MLDVIFFSTSTYRLPPDFPDAVFVVTTMYFCKCLISVVLDLTLIVLDHLSQDLYIGSDRARYACFDGLEGTNVIEVMPRAQSILV